MAPAAKSDRAESREPAGLYVGAAAESKEAGDWWARCWIRMTKWNERCYELTLFLEVYGDLRRATTANR